MKKYFSFLIFHYSNTFFVDFDKKCSVLYFFKSMNRQVLSHFVEIGTSKIAYNKYLELRWDLKNQLQSYKQFYE